MLSTSVKFPLFLSVTMALVVLSFSIHPPAVQAVSPTPPSRDEVCAIVMTMPNAENTDQLLSLLKTRRSEIVKDLVSLKSHMEQYDAEGYGWQNVINSPNALDHRPTSWLIGALRMACEY